MSSLMSSQISFQAQPIKPYNILRVMGFSMLDDKSMHQYLKKIKEIDRIQQP